MTVDPPDRGELCNHKLSLTLVLLFSIMQLGVWHISGAADLHAGRISVD